MSTKWITDNVVMIFTCVCMCDSVGELLILCLICSLLKSCVKIGEGVYGEVFRAQYENGESIALKVL